MDMVKFNSLRKLGLKEYKFSINTAIDMIVIQNSADLKQIPGIPSPYLG